MRTGVDLEFAKRLLELRTRFDIYPWVSMIREAIAELTPANTVRSPEFPHNFPLLVSEITGRSLAYPNPIDEPYNVNVKLQYGLESGVQGADYKMREAFGLGLVIGFPGSGWRRLGRGLFVDEADRLRTKIETSEAMDANATAYVDLNARGYRMWPRGSYMPQMSLEEARSTYTLSRYLEGVELTVPDDGTEVSAEIRFPDADFLAAGLLVDVPGFGTEEDGVEVKIESPRPIMDGWARATALGGAVPATQWDWPHPVTIPKGDRWVVRARNPTGQAEVNLSVVLDGYRLGVK